MGERCRSRKACVTAAFASQQPEQQRHLQPRTAAPPTALSMGGLRVTDRRGERRGGSRCYPRTDPGGRDRPGRIDVGSASPKRRGGGPCRRGERPHREPGRVDVGSAFQGAADRAAPPPRRAHRGVGRVVGGVVAPPLPPRGPASMVTAPPPRRCGRSGVLALSAPSRLMDTRVIERRPMIRSASCVRMRPGFQAAPGAHRERAPGLCPDRAGRMPGARSEEAPRTAALRPAVACDVEIP